MIDDSTLDILETPWDENETRGDIGVLGRLGFPCPNLHAFSSDLMDQIDGDQGGFRWWRDDWLTESNRRKIGDYILAAANAVATNLLEAQLHQLAFKEAAERNDGRVTIKLQQGRLEPKIRNTSPLDNLPATETELHTAGVMRAVGSVTDCLAALTIGVSGLKKNIVRASWSGMLRATEDNESVISRAEIEELVSNLGPNDWLAWTLGYRNTVVHRGRRLEFTVISGRLPATRCETYLAADPDATEAEAILRRGIGGRLIREESRTTIPGIVASTHALVETLTEKLHSIWSARVAGDLDISQPSDQWPRNEYTTTEFKGYAPGPLPNVDLGVMHPKLARRLRAAGG